MNTMKRMIALVLLLTVAVCLVACAKDTAETNAPTTAPNTTPTTTVPTQPQTTTKPADTATYNYKIRVVDQDGNPIEGAYVIFCLETCNFYVTDAEGWALIDAAIADGYQAHIMSLPAGYENYTFSEEYTNFESGQTEMILVATKNAE